MRAVFFVTAKDWLGLAPVLFHPGCERGKGEADFLHPDPFKLGDILCAEFGF